MRLFIISAPSGAGKTSLVNAVLENNRIYPIERAVTYTTRRLRIGEQQGIDYHFISELDFAQKIERNFFLDWQQYNNTYYGLSNAVLQKIENGIAQVAILDRAGALNVAAKVPAATLIWIHTPLSLLHERLIKRNTETHKQIEERLALARLEIEAEKRHPQYKYQLINDSFDQAVLDLRLILTKELT